MANPFGDVEVTQSGNPFGDAVVSANPFGDEPIGEAAPPKITGMGSALSALYGLPTAAKTLDETVNIGKNVVIPSAIQAYTGLQSGLLEEALIGRKARGEAPDLESEKQLREYRTVSKLAEEDIQGEMKGAGLGKEVGVGALNSIVANAPGLAASIFLKTPAPAIAGGALTTYGTSHAKSGIAHPELPFENRDNAAMAQAYAEGAFEGASVSYLLSRFGKDSIGKFIGKYMVAENATEIPTTVAQNIADWAELNPQKTFKDWAAETGHDVLVTALSTPLSAGVMGGGVSMLNSAVKEHQGKVQEKALNDMLTEMAGGVPEAEQLVSQVMESLRTRQYDPEAADLQKAQFQGKMAGVPNSPEGVQAAAGLDNLIKRAMPDSGGITPDVTERRESDKYIDFATADSSMPSAEHLVLASATQPEVAGLRLGQMPAFVDGSVTVVGGNMLAVDTLFRGMQPDALAQTIQTIAKLAGVSDPIVVNLTQPEGQTMAWYEQIDLAGNRRAHVITPRELPSFKHQGGNQNTLVDFAYSLTHEIGHALKMEHFDQGIMRGAANSGIGVEVAAPMLWKLKQELSSGQVSEETLTQLEGIAPVEAALLRDWQALKNGVLTGKMSGKEFADIWVGPRKLALGFNRTSNTQSIYSWLQREYTKNTKSQKDIVNLTAMELVDALGDPQEVLSFDEFMAEQFSRVAHDRNYMAGTPLGQWFQGALDKLRAFFGMLKAEGIVKPRVTFETWLDETVARQPKKRPKTWGKAKITGALKKAQKAQLAEMEAERQALQAEGEQELQEEEYELPEEEQVALEVRQESAREAIYRLVQMKLMKKGSPEHTKALAEIEKGQTAAVLGKAFDVQMGMKVHWDKDSDARAPANTAGATAEQETEAQGLWNKLKFDSPFFKRWFGNSQIKDGVTGKPLVVYRGDSFVVPFFDVRAARFEKVIFFAGSAQNAMVYATDPSKLVDRVPLDDKKKREAMEIRAQIEKLQSVLEGQRVKDPSVAHMDPKIVRKHKRALEENLNFLLETSPRELFTPTVGGYYLRMENPFEVDFAGDEWQHGAYDEFIQTAKELGHDGLIVHNVADPMLDTVYLLWDTTAAKNVENSGDFGKGDQLFWDRTKGEQSTLAKMVDDLSVVSPDVIKHSAAAFVHRMADALVQLQQRAIKPLVNGEVDVPMQAMLRALQLGQAYKNNLMQPGEALTKELESRKQGDLDQMYKFLQAEWRGKTSWFALQGWTGDPANPEAEQIWGDLPDDGRDISQATGLKVKYWTYVPTEKAIAQMNAMGIDTTVPHGQEMLQLILQMKQTMADQFTALERDLLLKIVNRVGSGALAQREVAELYQVMMKIRMSPFMPQGHFGNYAIVYQERKENAKKWERKFATTRIEYFESRGKWNAELRKAKAREKGSGDKLRVVGRRMEEYDGIPLHLPRNLLTNLENTGQFTKDQLEVLSEMMVPVGVEKVATRFMETWSGGVEGGSNDLLRVYANFIWHNANYIWKQKFRTDFAKAIAAQKALTRRAAKGTDELSMKLMDELDRNTLVMERVQEYVLHPPQEFHQLRLVATMVFLAYNAKTALMNLSTMMNTYAALTMEFGEIQGHKLMAQAAIDAARIVMMRKDSQTKHVNEEGLEGADNELAWMYNRAVSEGLIDQSYAYFLAGQANATSNLTQVRRGPIGKMGRFALDLGMLPFRTVEKANRLTTMVAFFEGERMRGVDVEEAYLNATKKMELTQGAYDAGNRAEAFRGGKALFTMFYTYMQMMVWHTTGGYARGMKAELARRRKEALDMGNPELAEKLVVQHMMGEHAYTAKLLLIYMLLGGLTGLPFVDNIKDFVIYLWRKVYGENPEIELRQFIKTVGGGGNFYNDPDLVMNGILHKVAGMDLSGSFSLGRIIPGTSIINKDFKSPEAWFGAFGVQAAGPFGGFMNAIVKASQAMDTASYSASPVTAVAKTFPGAIGAIGKAVDAAMLQHLKPTYGVLGKGGERLVEDPPGSGNFRDLTNWELVGMALGGNPTILSKNREKAFFETGEQIYWKTRTQGLLDARNKAIVLGDQDRLTAANAEIKKFNESLSQPYKALRITGKQLSESLRTHRKSIRDKEQDKVPKKLRGVEKEVREAF